MVRWLVFPGELLGFGPCGFYTFILGPSFSFGISIWICKWKFFGAHACPCFWGMWMYVRCRVILDVWKNICGYTGGAGTTGVPPYPVFFRVFPLGWKQQVYPSSPNVFQGVLGGLHPPKSCKIMAKGGTVEGVPPGLQTFWKQVFGHGETFCAYMYEPSHLLKFR